jgi:hypothetical protein
VFDRNAADGGEGKGRSYEGHDQLARGYETEASGETVASGEGRAVDEWSRRSRWYY